MKVLINHLGQHSLWSLNNIIPSGWQEVYESIDEEQCKQYIKDNWVNTKPGFLNK